MQVSVPQSYRRFPLTHALASAGQVRVLRALALQGGPLAVAQVARDAGMTPRGARLALESLAGQGLVRVMGQSRAQLYALDATHPLATAVQALFEHEVRAWEAAKAGLRQGLADRPEVRAAWLYGSVARGEDTPRSDVDIAVLLESDAAGGASAVREAIDGLARQLGLPVSAVVLTTADLERLPADDAWLGEVERDALVLKGGSPAAERDRCVRDRGAA